MAPPPWATPEQLAFLKHEDLKWQSVKDGNTTLKNFYAQVATSFLGTWPVVPDEKLLEKANGNPVEAKALGEEGVRLVSTHPHVSRHISLLIMCLSVSVTGSSITTAE